MSEIQPTKSKLLQDIHLSPLNQGNDYQGMEQFISSSPWSHRNLLDDIARGADQQFSHSEEASLNFDESSFLKKGKTPTRLKLEKAKNRARHLRVDEFVGGHFEKQHQVLSYPNFRITTFPAGIGTKPKCMRKSANAMPPSNETWIEDGTILPESRLI